MLNDYRRNLGLSAVLAGSAVAVVNVIQKDFLLAAAVLALVIVLACVVLWWTRPTRGGPHVSHAAAHATAADGGVIVYWRPGCRYCDRLKLGLGRARDDVTWVNILRDPDAAAFVASYRDGDLTVPTAVTGSGEMIDATAAAIKARLHRDT